MSHGWIECLFDFVAWRRHDLLGRVRPLIASTHFSLSSRLPIWLIDRVVGHYAVRDQPVPLHHRDRSILIRIEKPTPNPLVLR